MVKPKTLPVGRLLWCLVPASSLFTLCALRAAQPGASRFMAWEIATGQWVYDWPTSWLDLFLAITRLGSPWLLVPVGLLAWKLRSKWLALRLLLTGSVAVLAVEVVKLLVDRPRPFWLLLGIQSRELLVTGTGFPSGHTTFAMVIAGILAFYMPKKYWPLLAVWVGLVGVSRVYLGVHAFLDVVGGVLLGAIIVMSFEIIRRRRWHLLLHDRAVRFIT